MALASALRERTRAPPTSSLRSTRRRHRRSADRSYAHPPSNSPSAACSFPGWELCNTVKYVTAPSGLGISAGRYRVLLVRAAGLREGGYVALALVSSAVDVGRYSQQSTEVVDRVEALAQHPLLEAGDELGRVRRPVLQQRRRRHDDIGAC